MKIKFPSNFMWGSATSGPQSEGSFDKKNQSIMDYWFKKDPKSFHDNIGPSITSDTYHRYKEDIKIMKKIGLKSFRTSIQWTRLIDDLFKNSVDQKAVDFYRSYFKELKNNKIKIIVTLFHFDMPITLQDIGGFENKQVIDLFVGYAKKCFELFSDLVDDWVTFNEPIVPVEAGYLYKFHYPLIANFKKAIQVAYGTLLAHAKVVNAFHEYFKKDNKKIGIVLNLTPTYPKDNKLENVLAAKNRDLLFNKFFLDGSTKGEINKDVIKLIKEVNLIPQYSESEIKDISISRIDFLGVNFYQPARVQESKDKSVLMPERWFSEYIWEERRMNKYRGWEIYPRAIYDIAKNIKENYDNIPWYISENGMGVENEERFRNEKGYIQDDYRIDFIKEHLYWLNKAIEEGSNCFGYHLWTFIDCWSWANAYKNRYGFVEMNIDTKERLIKESGYWISKVISESNTFEIEDGKVIK